MYVLSVSFYSDIVSVVTLDLCLFLRYPALGYIYILLQIFFCTVLLDPTTIINRLLYSLLHLYMMRGVH